MELLKEKLSIIILLQLQDVITFNPLQNYNFPNNIQILSIEFSGTTLANYSDEDRKELFSGYSFNGVTYLRHRFTEGESYYCKTHPELSKIQKRVLKQLLNTTTWNI